MRYAPPSILIRPLFRKNQMFNSPKRGAKPPREDLNQRIHDWLCSKLEGVTTLRCNTDGWARLDHLTNEFIRDTGVVVTKQRVQQQLVNAAPGIQSRTERTAEPLSRRGLTRRRYPVSYHIGPYIQGVIVPGA